MKNAKRPKNANKRSSIMNSKSRFLLFSAAFALGTAFLLFGIYRGEVAVVLKKAISICLECIGIG